MVRIRLSGTLEEIEKAKKSIENALEVLSVSKPYRDRGKTELWRVYLECEVKDEGSK